MTQGCRAMVNRSCKYRQGINSCFVGCLISDEEYEPLMEDRNVESLIGALRPGEGHKELKEFLINWQPTLQRLQDIHDNKLIKEWATLIEACR